MKSRNREEFDPDVPIATTPATHPALADGAILVKVAVLEWVGAYAGHLASWPWWVGAQLPVIYLFWRLMHERVFYEGIVRAWNKRLRPDGGPRPADYLTIEQANEFIRRMEKRSNETD